MAIIKIVKDGVENQIIGDLDWAKSVYPDHTCEVVDEPTSEDQTTEQQAREWRDSELKSTDYISQTPDFPNRDKYLTYRQKLRDWPSTTDFPAKKPVLE